MPDYVIAIRQFLPEHNTIENHLLMLLGSLGHEYIDIKYIGSDFAAIVRMAPEQIGPGLTARGTCQSVHREGGQTNPTLSGDALPIRAALLAPDLFRVS